MTKGYNPGRGFFIGKVGIFLAIFTAAAISYPLLLKADTLPSGTRLAYGDSSTAIAANAVTVGSPLINAIPTWITAYASVPEETSAHPFVTASGQTVRDGIVAANFLPFGTQIQIPELFGNKIFTVEDRMNQRFSHRVDIWMPAVDKAVVFGIHHVSIVVLGSGVVEAQ